MGHAELSLDAALSERFDVIDLAGRGGMATVYRVVDRASGEQVALKIMPATDEARKRFAREAAALESLSHPCIVRHRGHGDLRDGRVYLAMEWVEGEALGARLRRTRIPMREALLLNAKLARALGAVHAAGLVHRDVKPGNVMLRGDDPTQPVLLDFGLVKPVVGEEITSVGIAVGTPGYMAPEQARGSSKLDARADIFGLACLLFRCITNERPFGGVDVTAILTKLLFDAAPSIRVFEPRAPQELDELVTAMLAKNPEDRPRDATAIAIALEQLAAREAPSQVRVVPEAVALTPAEQRPVSVVVVAEARGGVTEEREYPPDAQTMVAPVESSEVLLRPAESPVARDEVVALAESLGGVAETLANGALVVVFEGSTNARDQCVRAARCALRLKALAPDKAVVLASGRGHSSGGSIVGEAIDRAVVTLRGAMGDGARVDAASVQLLEPRFEVTSGPAPRLVMERSERLTARTLLGAPTPCVGRDTEIRAVLGTLEQCIEDGGARVVAITADAGVGKSRLAAEVVVRAASDHATLSVWLGRGDPLFERSPLALVGRMVREIAQVSPLDAVDVRRAKLRGRVARHIPEGDVATTTEFLGEICGVPFDDEGRPALRAARSDPQLMANHLKAAFERFVVAQAAAQPLMIVVEDLHWADALSISYLQKMVARLATSSLLLLVLSRPEGEDRFPGLFTEATHLRMRPLSAKAATKLARAVLGEQAAAATIQRVVDLAAGNAFYLEELIRAVSDGHGDLPETVVLMAQARLQTLDPEARRVLRAASVFGEAFSEQDIAALEGGEAAVRWLPPLVERELLTRAPAGGAFSFRHALLREAAYASLTDEDRVLGHRLAARRLEARGDRNAMSIADHHARGGEEAAAVDAYVRAAEQALQAGDFEGPVLAMDRGRACGATDVRLGRLEGLAARALWLKGDMAASEALGREALGKLGPGQPAWYEAIADLGNALQGRLDHAGIEGLARMILDRPAPVPIQAAYSRALSLAYTLVIQNAPTSALSKELTAAIDAVAQAAAGDPLIEARIAVARAFGAVAERHPSAAGQFELAARRMEELGNPEVARMQRNAQGTALGWNGAWEEAVAILDAIPQAAGRAWLWTRVTLAWSLAHIERFDEATAALEHVLAEGGEDAFLMVESHLTLARVETLQGRFGEALARIEACLKDASLPKAIVVRLHAAAFEAARAIMGAGTDGSAATSARAHGQAVCDLLEAGVVLVEDAVYVRAAGIVAKKEAGDVEAARASARKALALVESYGELIEDAAQREAYYGRVRENAQVLELARELGVERTASARLR